MASHESRSPAAYGGPDRLLHHVALGSRAVMETSFDIERAMFGKSARHAIRSGPVFVCGLARAGTSLVTRLLDESGTFASLRYRDMPFPLAPNLWARLSGGDQRRVPIAERAHGDGMVHDLDTPEAIEEVFWRCFEGDRYILSDGLAPVTPRSETMDGYRQLMELVGLRGGGGRYLAKNNNHVLRLQCLVDAFPDAILIHPFRHPLTQAGSLLGQHVRTCELQSNDSFSRSYSAWLVHHEFGVDQRPHLFPGSPLAQEKRSDLEYWLKCWHSVYGFLLDQAPHVRLRQVFVDYDDLCRRPVEVLDRLATRIGCPSLNPEAIRDAGSGASAVGDFPLYDALQMRVSAG